MAVKYRIVHTITLEDVGKKHIIKECPCCSRKQTIPISEIMGCIMECDVGKRIVRYLSGHYGVESDKQRDTRLIK